MVLLLLCFEPDYCFEVVVVFVTHLEQLAFAFDQVVKYLGAFSLVAFEHVSE